MEHCSTVRDDIGPALASWAERERRLRLILDDDLLIDWMNCAARAFISSGAGFVERQNRFVPRNVRLEPQFRAFIRAATSATTSYCVRMGDGDEHIVLSAVRLESAGKGRVGLTVRNTQDSYGLELADLRQAFGLTSSEGAVAKLLLGGETADGAATRLGVSIDTVRTHIKRTYCKLSVSSREGLLHKLAPYVLAA